MKYTVIVTDNADDQSIIYILSETPEEFLHNLNAQGFDESQIDFVLEGFRDEIPLEEVLPPVKKPEIKDEIPKGLKHDFTMKIRTSRIVPLAVIFKANKLDSTINWNGIDKIQLGIADGERDQVIKVMEDIVNGVYDI